MSTNLAIPGNPEDSREIELVVSLTDKTKQGKVRWMNALNAMTTSLPGSLEANFVTQVPLAGGLSWKLFTVRDSRGNELVRVAPPSLIAMFGTAQPPLVEAIDELFGAIQKTHDDDLEKAISSIKNL